MSSAAETIRVLYLNVRISPKAPPGVYTEVMRAITPERIRDAVMLAVPCSAAAYVDVEVE